MTSKGERWKLERKCASTTNVAREASLAFLEADVNVCAAHLHRATADRASLHPLRPAPSSDRATLPRTRTRTWVRG